MDKISNTALEKKIFSSRMVLAFFAVFILTLVLVSRVYNLQIINFDYYAEESLGNQMRTLPITPTRGKIFDRNGKIIATNQLAYTLTLTPEKTQNIALTLQALKRVDLIDEDDIKAFYKNRKQYKKFHSIPLKYKLSEQQVAEFLVSNQFVGVDVEPYFHRVYPYNDIGVHVVGYVSKMNRRDKAFYDKKNYFGTAFVGKTGIEKQYETLLHGNSGKKQIERNVTGRVIDTQIIQSAENGKNLYLSIDLDMQQKAESLLKGKRGAIVVIDVTNGEVLTLASSPVYNPNWFVTGISHANYKKLQTSEDIPQLNRAIRGLYPPASLIKPMVALAGLEQGVINKRSNVFDIGYYQLPGVKRKFRNWDRNGHGLVNVTDAIVLSNDVFFYDLANKMGIDNLYKGLNLFNFGQKTGIDIPGEKGGILPSRAWKKTTLNQPWYKGETLNAGIGQGFITSTPLQLAVATAAIANKGQLLQPSLLKAVQTLNGNIVETKKKQGAQIPIKDIKNWETIINSMKQVVYSAKGTARRINKNLNYTLAGKTGTAQVFGLGADEIYDAKDLVEKLRDHALFSGFAPIKNPEIAIAVIVENAGYGSSKAAPLAKQVLDVYFNKKSTQRLAQ